MGDIIFSHDGVRAVPRLYNIFQKLHFSKSHFSETVQEKHEHIIFLQPKSHKKCRKIFENRFTNKIIMPENYLEYAFSICKGGNPNTLKLKIKQICGNFFKSLAFSYA